MKKAAGQCSRQAAAARANVLPVASVVAARERNPGARAPTRRGTWRSRAWVPAVHFYSPPRSRLRSDPSREKLGGPARARASSLTIQDQVCGSWCASGADQPVAARLGRPNGRARPVYVADHPTPGEWARGWRTDVWRLRHWGTLVFLPVTPPPSTLSPSPRVHAVWGVQPRTAKAWPLYFSCLHATIVCPCMLTALYEYAPVRGWDCCLSRAENKRDSV